MSFTAMAKDGRRDSYRTLQVMAFLVKMYLPEWTQSLQAVRGDHDRAYGLVGDLKDMITELV
jgi:hypothetical protein